MILLLLGLAFIILTAVGMPISFAVGVSTVFATLLLPGVDNATIVQRMLTAINTFPLLAVIFFVFAGTLMARGGIARRLVLMAEVLVGWLPGSAGADRVRRLDVLRRRHRLGGRRGFLHRRDDDPRDGEGRLLAPLCHRDRAHRRHDGPDHSALDRHDRVRACRRQRLDRGAVSRRRHPRRDDRHVADDRLVRPRQALSPEDAAEARDAREDAPRDRRHGRRVHDGDHPRRHHFRRVHRDRGGRGGGASTR